MGPVEVGATRRRRAHRARHLEAPEALVAHQEEPNLGAAVAVAVAVQAALVGLPGKWIPDIVHEY